MHFREFVTPLDVFAHFEVDDSAHEACSKSCDIVTELRVTSVKVREMLDLMSCQPGTSVDTVVILDC